MTDRENLIAALTQAGVPYLETGADVVVGPTVEFDADGNLVSGGTTTDPFTAEQIDYLVANYPLRTDLSAYALKTEVPAAPDLSPYALKTEIPASPDLTPYALKTEIPASPDLTPYALKTEIPASPDLSPYALKTEIPVVPPLPDLTPYALKDHVPSLDEQFFTASVGPYQAAFGAGTANYFMVAPYRMRVTGASFYLYSGMTANDTNYNTVAIAVRRVSDGTYTPIVRGYVKLTGPNAWGYDLAYGKSYSLNAFEWDAAAALLSPGDTLAFSVNKTGTATMPTGQAAVTVTYVPEPV